MASETTPHTWANSDAYEAFMGRWSRIAADAALDWLDLPAGLRWLDVGCGTGASAEAIVTGADPSALTGIDPSPDFLAQAKQRVRDPRVTFEAGNAEALPVVSDQFDVAIACLVLHFMSDPQQGVREMMRCVRPGGTVAGYIWDIASDEQFTSPFWRAAESLDPRATAWEPLYRQKVNSAERVTTLFDDAPLDNVVAATLDFPIVFRNFADYWEPCLLDGSPPVQRYMATLSDDGKAALRGALRERLPVADDGLIPLRGRLWITRGTKAEQGADGASRGTPADQ